MALPPDCDFATRVLLWAHYQYYYYIHWLQENMSANLFQDYGQFLDCESDVIRQVWFKEDQLPLSLATKWESWKIMQAVSSEGNAKDEYKLKTQDH